MLPIGTMLVGSIYAARAIYNGSLERMASIKKKIAEAEDVVLQEQIANALAELRYQQASSGTPTTPASPSKTTKYTASDVFLAIDETKGSGDGVLAIDEIENMFRIFKLNVDRTEVDQFIAYCDTDGSGDVSVEEFQAGWDYFTDSKLDNSLESFGISTTEAVLAALIGFATIVILGIFVILGIQAFSGAGTFGAVVQSLVIGAIANGTASVRKERQKNDDGIVEAIIIQQSK
jgi:hypothetical protein